MTEQAVRCVITGFDAEGRSVILSDSELRGSTEKWGPGMPYWPVVWGADETPVPLPVGGVPPRRDTDWPDENGVRVRILERTPGYGVPAGGTEAAILDLDPETAFHRTNTVDVIFIQSGEVGLLQDDGVETVVRAGDILIIQGTRHSWKPRGECRLAAVVIGARRDG